MAGAGLLVVLCLGLVFLAVVPLSLAQEPKTRSNQPHDIPKGLSTHPGSNTGRVRHSTASTHGTSQTLTSQPDSLTGTLTSQPDNLITTSTIRTTSATDVLPSSISNTKQSIVISTTAASSQPPVTHAQSSTSVTMVSASIATNRVSILASHASTGASPTVTLESSMINYVTTASLTSQPTPLSSSVPSASESPKITSEMMPLSSTVPSTSEVTLTSDISLASLSAPVVASSNPASNVITSTLLSDALVTALNSDQSSVIATKELSSQIQPSIAASSESQSPSVSELQMSASASLSPNSPTVLLTSMITSETSVLSASISDFLPSSETLSLQAAPTASLSEPSISESLSIQPVPTASMSEPLMSVPSSIQPTPMLSMSELSVSASLSEVPVETASVVSPALSDVLVPPSVSESVMASRDQSLVSAPLLGSTSIVYNTPSSIVSTATSDIVDSMQTSNLETPVLSNSEMLPSIMTPSQLLTPSEIMSSQTFVSDSLSIMLSSVESQTLLTNSPILPDSSTVVELSPSASISQTTSGYLTTDSLSIVPPLLSSPSYSSVDVSDQMSSAVDNTLSLSIAETPMLSIEVLSTGEIFTPTLASDLISTESPVTASVPLITEGSQFITPSPFGSLMTSMDVPPESSLGSSLPTEVLSSNVPMETASVSMSEVLASSEVPQDSIFESVESDGIPTQTILPSISDFMSSASVSSEESLKLPSLSDFSSLSVDTMSPSVGPLVSSTISSDFPFSESVMSLSTYIPLPTSGVIESTLSSEFAIDSGSISGSMSLPYIDSSMSQIVDTPVITSLPMSPTPFPSFTYVPSISATLSISESMYPTLSISEPFDTMSVTDIIPSESYFPGFDSSMSSDYSSIATSVFPTEMSSALPMTTTPMFSSTTEEMDTVSMNTATAFSSEPGKSLLTSPLYSISPTPPSMTSSLMTFLPTTEEVTTPPGMSTSSVMPSVPPGVTTKLPSVTADLTSPASSLQPASSFTPATSARIATSPLPSTNIATASTAPSKSMSMIPSSIVATPTTQIPMTSSEVTTGNVTESPVLTTEEPPATENTTDYRQYWVITVLQVKLDIDVGSEDFTGDLEIRFVELYAQAFRDQEARQVGGRFRREATSQDGNVTLVLVNSTRPHPDDPDPVKAQYTDMVYYMSRNGNMTPAADAVAALEPVNIQEMAIRLGYVVVDKAAVYDPELGPEPVDKKLWIIGAVLGGIVALIAVVWCVLFVYFKCTRPPKYQSPRSSRMSGYIDPDYKKSEIRGFDIARTEVGIENEIASRDKHKVEPYKSRSNGNTNLEGMYPPRDADEELGPAAKKRQSGRDDQPMKRPQKTKKKHRRDEGSEEGDTEDASDDDRRRGQRSRPKQRDSQGKRVKDKPQRQSTRDSISEDEIDPVRSTTHNISMPPMIPQALLGERLSDEEREMQDSLREKSDSERWRNKQRQRDKKQGRRRKPYEDPQAEIDAVLDPESVPQVYYAQPKKSRKKPHRRHGDHDVQDADPDNMEMSDMFGPSPSEYRRRGRPEYPASDSENDIPPEEPDLPLEEARERMHSLLDQAFTLINPNAREDEGEDYQPGNLSPAVRDPGHTPMKVTHMSGSQDPGADILWNPYRAGDETAKMTPQVGVPPGHRRPYSAHSGNMQDSWDGGDKSRPIRPVSASHQYTNPGYIPDERSPTDPISLGSRSIPNSQLATDSAPPIKISTRTPEEIRKVLGSPNYGDVIMDAKMFAPSSMRPHTPPEKDVSSRHGSSKLPNSDLPSYESATRENKSPRQKSQRNSAEIKTKDGDSWWGTKFESIPITDLDSPRKEKSRKSSSSSVQSPRDKSPRDKSSSSRKSPRKGRPRSNLEPGDDEVDVVQKVMKPGASPEPLVNSIREELQRLSSRPNGHAPIV